MQALGRLKAGAMNRMEAEYDRELALRVRAGVVAWYRFEGITLKLGADCRFTPDFFVMLANAELACFEVKGTAFADDAKVKLRVAAAMFPFRFYLVTRPTKGGGFIEEEVPSA